MGVSPKPDLGDSPKPDLAELVEAPSFFHTAGMNKLFYGDDLDVLREHIADAPVDLVYLDPPFNSSASYNILFKSPTGEGADASIEAFDDTWSWGPTAEGALLALS